jgi:hypothetical protein
MINVDKYGEEIIRMIHPDNIAEISFRIKDDIHIVLKNIVQAKEWTGWSHHMGLEETFNRSGVSVQAIVQCMKQRGWDERVDLYSHG